MNPLELLRTTEQHQQHTRLAAWSSAIAGVALLSLALTVPRGWLRLSVASIGVSCGVLGVVHRQRHQQQAWIPKTFTHACQAGLQRYLLQQFKQTAKQPAQPNAVLTPLAALSPLQFFDWQVLQTEPDRYPHLLLCGETGAGKTTTAEHLIKILGAAEVLIISPHRKPGDWDDRPVLGSGRRYGAIEAGIQQLEAQMTQRYEQYEQGQFDYPAQVIVIDEFGSVASHCKDAMPCIHALLQEARKVRMRLIILAHSQSVKLLEMEGKGELRACFRKLYLGTFALNQAKQRKDPALLEWVKAQTFPAILEDQPADLAKLAALAQQFVPAAQPRQTPTLTQELPTTESDRSLEGLLDLDVDRPDVSQLDSPLKQICAYSSRKGWVSASDLKRGVRLLRSIPTEEIWQYCETLLHSGYGAVRGEGSSRQWRINPIDSS